MPDYGKDFIPVSKLHLEKSQKFLTCILGAMKKRYLSSKETENIVEVGKNFWEKSRDAEVSKAESIFVKYFFLWI